MSNRRTIALVSGAVLIAIGVTCVVFMRTTEQLTFSALSWCGKVEADWNARDFVRPGAAGVTDRGAAWEHYDQALRLTQSIEQANQPDWTPAIDALRTGARLDNARPPVDWSAHYDQELVPVTLQVTTLAKAAAEQATRELPADPTASVALLLDVATFAVDHTRGPSLVHEALGTTALQEVIDALPPEQLQAMPDDALEALAQGLSVLDLHFSPHLGSAATDIAIFGGALVADPTELGMLDIGIADLFRYGFSTRRMAASAVLDVAGAIDTLDQSRGMRWPQRKSLFHELAAGLSASPNPLASFVIRNWIEIEHAKRRVLADLRLLRMAVAWRRGDTVEPLPDPLGPGQLQFIEDGSGAKFRSQGTDDVDGGNPIERSAPPRR